MSAFEHHGVVCGRTELLTTEQAHRAGWDYPPKIGAWGVISPRTHGSCPMDKAVWCAIQVKGYDVDQLSPKQRKTVARILNERPNVTSAARSHLPPDQERQSPRRQGAHDRQARPYSSQDDGRDRRPRPRIRSNPTGASQTRAPSQRRHRCSEETYRRAAHPDHGSTPLNTAAAVRQPAWPTPNGSTCRRRRPASP